MRFNIEASFERKRQHNFSSYQFHVSALYFATIQLMKSALQKILLPLRISEREKSERCEKQNKNKRKKNANSSYKTRDSLKKNEKECKNIKNSNNLIVSRYRHLAKNGQTKFIDAILFTNFLIINIIRILKYEYKIKI